MEALDKITLNVEPDKLDYDALLSKLINLNTGVSLATSEFRYSQDVGPDRSGLEETLNQLTFVEEELHAIRKQLINELGEAKIEEKSYEDGEIIGEYKGFVIKAGSA